MSKLLLEWQSQADRYRIVDTETNAPFKQRMRLEKRERDAMGDVAWKRLAFDFDNAGAMALVRLGDALTTGDEVIIVRKAEEQGECDG